MRSALSLELWIHTKSMWIYTFRMTTARLVCPPEAEVTQPLGRGTQTGVIPLSFTLSHGSVPVFCQRAPDPRPKHTPCPARWRARSTRRTRARLIPGQARCRTATVNAPGSALITASTSRGLTTRESPASPLYSESTP